MKKIRIGDNLFDLGNKTLIMGVLNITSDSFYDKGRYLSFDDAVKHALKMERQGADIIDIGGESTRPGATTVTLAAEMSRVIPLVEELANKLKIPISVDTYKSEIAEKALKLGAGMINDITALRADKKMPDIINKYDVPICLMHMQGTPSTMQVQPYYDDVIGEIKDFLKQRIKYAQSCDIRKENIIIDPGIGFGKRTGEGFEDNCEILGRLTELNDLDTPILVGASRKTFIGNISGKDKALLPKDRLEGSLAAAVIAAYNGANIIRVHDVKETRRALDIVDCVKKDN